MWSTETLGGLATVLTVMLTAIGTAYARINARINADAKQSRQEVRELRAQVLLAERYLFTLTRAMSRHGLDVPAAPGGLYADEHTTHPGP